jgi:hypothetical protein
MLEMIFANSDFPEYGYYSNSTSENKHRNTPPPKYRVEIDHHLHQVSININDDEPEWGYYIDLDTSTPPKINYSKNIYHHPKTLNLPKKNYTINKQINYLPTIEEESFNIKNDTKSYMVDEISATSSVISGVTFCATIAFYYFYRSMRN